MRNQTWVWRSHETRKEMYDYFSEGAPVKGMASERKRLLKNLLKAAFKRFFNFF